MNFDTSIIIIIIIIEHFDSTNYLVLHCLNVSTNKLTPTENFFLQIILTANFSQLPLVKARRTSPQAPLIREAQHKFYNKLKSPELQPKTNLRNQKHSLQHGRPWLKPLTI